MFRVFAILVSLVLGGISVYLVGNGSWDAYNAIKVGVSDSSQLIAPIFSVVGGLLLAGACYYGLWTESPVRRSLDNIFSIPELIKKIAFTLGLLCIYRIGYHIPLPGLDEFKLQEELGKTTGTFGDAMAYFGMFTGGNLQQSTLFGLGIMPYISASIIFQLLTTVVPALEKLKKEGPAGYKKIQEYTRYATVLLCVIQAAFWMKYMSANYFYQDTNPTLVYLMGVIGLTAGTMFMMWLGEQIDQYGIGNGISLIIMGGIVARLPWAINTVSEQARFKLIGQGGSELGFVQILFLVAAFVFVVAGAILITQAQRRIPIQQAKQMRGRRVYGGQRQYLPLRVNHGGVMPIIFASSLMIFPGVIFKWMADTAQRNQWPLIDFWQMLHSAFTRDGFTYNICYIGLIFFFAYFWTTVQFRPKEMAEQLRDYGSFIPGLRPGRRTADYLERVMERITYCGAGFLSAIAVAPMVMGSVLHVNYQVTQFLGGTGLLIVISVALDLVQRIEANLVMRNYGGFLGGSTRIKGAYS